MLREIRLIAILFFLVGANLHAQAPGTRATTSTGTESEKSAPEQARVDSIEPEQANRGGTVTVTGEFPTEPVDIRVELKIVVGGTDAKSVLAEKVALKKRRRVFHLCGPTIRSVGALRSIGHVHEGGYEIWTNHGSDQRGWNISRGYRTARQD